MLDFPDITMQMSCLVGIGEFLHGINDCRDIALCHIHHLLFFIMSAIMRYLYFCSIGWIIYATHYASVDFQTNSLLLARVNITIV